MVKILKFCSASFNRLTKRRVVFEFREIWPMRNRRNRGLFIRQKNTIYPACQTVATARIAPKILQGQPQQCAQSAPNFI